MTFRVVGLKLKENTYEYLITNLDADEFSCEEMKELYHLRWSEETSFRKLKYTIGLVNFHAKKKEFIQQEIYARMIFFNLCNRLVQLADPHYKTKKYAWKVNFSTAVTNIRNYINGKIHSSTLLERLKKILAPIRPERTYDRNVRPQSVKSLTNKPS